MQSGLSRIFLSLLLAHLAGDFLLQTESMLESKRRLEWRGYLKHWVLHCLSACVAIEVFTDVSLGAFRATGAVIGLTVLHIMSDYGRCALGRRGRAEAPWFFLCDQSWHVVTVGAAALMIAAPAWIDLKSRFFEFHSVREKLLPALVIYVGFVFGGGSLVKNLTKPLLDSFTGLTGERDREVRELKNAGKYIGWLERFLVISALAMQSPATVGLILTAKSIVRFPELKDVRFAEYFPIGTLLSMSAAVAGGMALVWVLYGTLSLK
jgi:hypothetical protein